MELYHENNLYDLPENGCLLAEPNSEAIATAILNIFADEKLQRQMSAAGYKYMQDYQRYIVTGKHNKKNYEKVPYSYLKKCNYIYYEKRIVFERGKNERFNGRRIYQRRRRI